MDQDYSYPNKIVNYMGSVNDTTERGVKLPINFVTSSRKEGTSQDSLKTVKDDRKKVLNLGTKSISLNKIL